ncbi:eisosome protein SEG2-like [Triticum dicoccoides]|uniref:eisosome protein SEG2-like n=1 Tax=Triticum dicoccoides TaxID=85692 RepID=UPI0018906FA6|nr:eisosome protein SEG2-like [Triticum dicoccoides]
MGCFLGCFGGAKSKKERRHRRRKQRSPSHSPSKAARDAEAAAAAAPLLATLLELRDSADDLCLAVVAKKKVTFDPNVTAYDAPPIPEGGEEATEAEEEEGRAAAKAEEAWTLLGPECAKSEAFPLNHRYGNCAGADDDSDYEDCYDDDDDEYEYEDDEEEEDDDLDGIDECAVDDDEEHGGLLGIARGEEDACDSLFLLPAPKTYAKDNAATGAGQTGAAAEAPAAEVLNSVENFSQWKDATKPHTAVTKDSEKENLVTLSDDPATAPAMKQEKPAVSWDYTPRTPSKQEASVDASLSTWLGSSGTPESNYSVRSYSPISREDRPILGALTVEDIKISSANSSPRRSRSPSPSPDDMPILGTVGAYWNCSGAKGGSDDSVTRGGFMKTRSRFGQNLA